MARVLTDLKRCMKVGFFLIRAKPESLLPGNGARQFAEKVIGPLSLCVVSNTVFGRLAAHSLGYAPVVLEQTIRESNPCWRVVLYRVPRHAARPSAGPATASSKSDHWLSAASLPPVVGYARRCCSRASMGEPAMPTP